MADYEEQAKELQLIAKWKAEDEAAIAANGGESFILLEKAIEFCISKPHMWCQHFEMAKECLSIFEFEYEEFTQSNRTFFEKNRLQLSTCLECSLRYRRTKTQLIKNLIGSNFDKDSITVFTNSIEKEERERVKQHLRFYKDDCNVLIILIHEVINNIELLHDQTLKKMFLDTFENFINDYSVSFGDPNKKVPGIYVMLMGQKKSLKEWAITFLKTVQPIAVDEFQSVHPVLDRLGSDLVKAQYNESRPDTIFSDNTGDIWDGLPLFIKQFSSVAFKSIFPKKTFLPIIIKELEFCKSTLRSSVVESLLLSFGHLKSNVWGEIPNTSPKQAIDIFFKVFQRTQDDAVQKSILKLFLTFLQESCPENVVPNYSKAIVGSFLQSSIQNSTTVKHDTFIFIVDALLNCYSVEYVNLWGKRLVHYSTNVPSEKVTPNFTDMQRAIKLLEHSLLFSAIELRKRVQHLYNSQDDEEVEKILNDSCEGFWFSSIWRTLLETPPTAIPYSVHLVIFKIHRILCLINNTPSNPKYNYSPIYTCITEYQELMGKYLEVFEHRYSFTLPVTAGDLSVILDPLDHNHFHKSIFSFLVSPNPKIIATFKRLLLKKHRTQSTVTLAFKASITDFPDQTSKGVLGVFRDFFFQLGFKNCMESVNWLFYYSDHLLFVLKKILTQVHCRQLFGPCVDAMWPTFQYGLSLNEEIVGANSTIPFEKVKYMFEWFKDSFSSINQNGFCSINDITPSFLNACGENRIVLFESEEQYPIYIRKIMKAHKIFKVDESCSITLKKLHYRVDNERGTDATTTFNNDYDFFFENLDYIYKNQEQQPIKESESLVFLETFSKSSTNSLATPIVVDDEKSRIFSIISNHSIWVRSFLIWNSLTQTEWFDSLTVIIKSLVKNQIKPDKHMELFINTYREMPLNQVQMNKIQASLVPPPKPVTPVNEPAWNSTPLPTTVRSSTIKITSGNIVASSLSAPTNTPSNPPIVVNNIGKHKPPSRNSFVNSNNNNNNNNNNGTNVNGNSSGYDRYGKPYPTPKPLSQFLPNSFSTRSNNYSSGSGNINSNNSNLPGGFNGSSYKSRYGGDDDEGIDSFERNSTSIPSGSKDKKRTMMVDFSGASMAPSYKKYKDKVPSHLEDLVPKIETLHKIILNWIPSKFANDPPLKELKQVPDTFNDLKHYINVFEPLLIEEFRAQVLRNLEEGETPTEGTVVNFGTESYFMDVDYELPVRETYDLLVDDFVLVIETASRSSQNQAHKEQKYLSAFGKIEKREKKSTKQRGGGNPNSNFDRGLDIRVRFIKDNTSPFFQQVNKINSKWNIQKITSLSTISREYLALHHVGKIPLGAAIISPNLYVTSNDDHNPNYSIPGPLYSLLRKTLNDSQMSAIISTVQNLSGFSLLQGPPGTGKTKTIMSLLSVFSSVLSNTEKANADPKILVCAPSNAAVDEIAIRLIREGLINAAGQKFHPKVCRIGANIHISPNVQKISVDNLMADELADGNSTIASEDAKVKNSSSKVKKIRSEQDEVKNKILDLEARQAQAEKNKEDDGYLRNEITKLTYTREKYNNDLKLAKDEERRSNDQYGATRRNLFINIIARSQIILSTLSGSGYDNLKEAIKHFDLVIVDEAAQAVELSTLIPLRHDVKKCILVGDPQQLPPTTISKVATKFQYEVSLFQRLMKSGMCPTVLKTQYRMHPTISKFPSRIFYKGELEDGENVKSYKQDFYNDPEGRFGPLVFYDVYGEENEVKSSFMSLNNPTEVKLARLIVDELSSKYPMSNSLEIGVITPYRSQMNELSRAFKEYSNVEVNTIDGFQGKEKDFIIFSTVRSHGGSSIGFLSDIRRMNVGLTRGKYSMIILGNSGLLSNNEDWGKFIEDIKISPNNYFSITSKSIRNGQLVKLDNPKPQTTFTMNDNYGNSNNGYNTTTTTTSNNSNNDYYNNNYNSNRNRDNRDRDRDRERDYDDRDKKRYRK